MPRIVSLIVLLVIVLGISILSFQVLASFLLPLFLALLLTVIFRPLHAWLVVKCHGRERVAAGLTTAAILLMVLLPLGMILTKAILEARDLASRIDQPQVENAYHNFREDLDQLRQQPWLAWLKLPNEGENVEGEVEQATISGDLVNMLKGPAAAGARVLGNLIQMLFGFAIMIVGLYYFLADGPTMLAAVSRLLPLEDRFEQQLLNEFSKISRVVVVAMLLSAFVQGALAGVAYWFTGFESVFFLTLLTMMLAMIPFVGAASVWGGCSLWLYLYDNQPYAALGLAIYGMLVVSLADNVVKPLVLRGQANLHPLLGLLSVLGGVKALGPIGIFVGPMAVAFLQALLVMVSLALKEMGATTAKSAEKPPLIA